MCKTLETNLQIIADAARQRAEENHRFKTFLRKQPSAQLDALVEKLNAEVEPHIDCKTCGNCCRSLHAAALEHELPVLAARLSLSIDDFKAAFLAPYKEGFYFAVKPCPMLEPNNLCSVYAHRPLCCQTFPNLVGPHFKYRFHLVLEKYPICPIVFNVVEQLKSALGFKHATEAET